jgi:hypothetical protein
VVVYINYKATNRLSETEIQRDFNSQISGDEHTKAHTRELTRENTQEDLEHTLDSSLSQEKLSLEDTQETFSGHIKPLKCNIHVIIQGQSYEAQIEAL